MFFSLFFCIMRFWYAPPLKAICHAKYQSGCGGGGRKKLHNCSICQSWFARRQTVSLQRTLWIISRGEWQHPNTSVRLGAFLMRSTSSSRLNVFAIPREEEPPSRAVKYVPRPLKFFTRPSCRHAKIKHTVEGVSHRQHLNSDREMWSHRFCCQRFFSARPPFEVFVQRFSCHLWRCFPQKLCPNI